MIIIPMAGLSSRFFKAGYTLPKYQLPLPNGQTVFEWAVTSFSNYFTTEKFLFIVRDVFDTVSFVEKYAKGLGINQFEIVVLSEETRGQAETVALGLRTYQTKANYIEEGIFIFNIDSKRYGFLKPSFVNKCDGYLEVFEGEGTHWSFIELDDSNRVIRTTEKDRISNLCSDGLYYFSSVPKFLDLVEGAIANKDLVNGELYIAPLYNSLIKAGRDIRYELIEQNQILFCGTPKEYEDIVTIMSNRL